MRYINLVKCFHFVGIFLSVHYVALIPACVSDYSFSSVFEDYDDAFLTRMANSSGTIMALYEAGKKRAPGEIIQNEGYSVTVILLRSTK